MYKRQLLEWDIKYGEYDSWDTYFDNSGRRWLRLEGLKAQRKRYRHIDIRDLTIVLRDKGGEPGGGHPKYVGWTTDGVQWVTMNGTWVSQV